MAFVFIGLLAVLLIIAWFWVTIYEEMSQAMLEYEKAWPGSCGICAFHAYGIRELGVGIGTLPLDHRCPEKWERWKGSLHPHRGV